MRKVYQSDLSDKRWQAIKLFLPDAIPGGRPRETCLREIINAIFYVNRTGCSWRDLPGDFPPWQTIYTYFRHWRDSSLWKKNQRYLEKTLAKACGAQVSGECWRYRLAERQMQLSWWGAWFRRWKKDSWAQEAHSR